VLRTDDILLSELRQRSARKVPRHEHELAYFTVVLDGDYLEGDRVMEELSPFTAAFNPSGVSHSTVVGPAGAAFFTVELRNLPLQPLDLRLPAETMVDRGAGPILWPGLRLYSAFKTRTADPLLLESHVLEMLGAISKVEPVEKTVPRWFVRVKERLHQDFREALRMRDLARDAGVHPVHLARMFRAREKKACEYAPPVTCCATGSGRWRPSPPTAASRTRAISHASSAGWQARLLRNSAARWARERNPPGLEVAPSPVWVPVFRRSQISRRCRSLGLGRRPAHTRVGKEKGAPGSGAPVDCERKLSSRSD
jgi:hypothetical protein